MCQYSAVDGFANDWHLVHLGSRAAGGAGLIIQEATSVSPEGRISQKISVFGRGAHRKISANKSIYCESKFSSWNSMAHAGRKASAASPWNGGRKVAADQGGWDSVAPSGIAYHESEKHLLH
jgi:2,4-dienoyl-CoA reductase-like NADH-dependent reductase (Old Yellow Enzyme family)